MTRHADDAGLTMTELMMMVLVMSVLMIMMTESLATLSGVRVEQKAHFRIGDVADRIGRRIERDVDYATRVFTAAPGDLEYLQAMDVGPAVLAAGGRLPLRTDIGYFAPDPAASAQTGNVLFVAARGPRVALELDGGGTRLVQVLRFVVYAPVDVAGQLDLMRWVGDPMVSYWDVVAIQDPGARAGALAELYENGIRYAWDPQAGRGDGLFEVRPSGALELLALDERVAGDEDAEESQPFRPRAMRLAQASLPGVPVPAYAHGSSGFAGAFEIKVDGAANGKLVLLRFVVVATEVVKRQVWTEIHRLVSTNG